MSNHFLDDCKIGTSPEKMYSVDVFRKSVIMSNVLDCSEGHVCTLRGTQNKAFRRLGRNFEDLIPFAALAYSNSPQRSTLTLYGDS